MDLRQRLENILASQQRDSDTFQELEIRFGYKDDRQRFVTNLGRNNYAKIVQLLHSNKNWLDVKNVNQTDYFCTSRQLRLTVSDDKEECVRKVKNQTWDFPNFNGTNWTLRVSLSSEQPVSDKVFGDNADFSREKQRLRFVHKNRHGMTWNYDATVVKSVTDTADPDQDDGDLMYEFELEVDVQDKVDTSYLAHSTELKILDVFNVIA